MGWLAEPEYLRPADIPGRHVGYYAMPLVLELYPPGSPRPRRQRGSDTLAGLKPRLLVGADHVVLWAQQLALPESLVQVQHAPRLESELRIAREYPTAVVPRLDRVGLQPSPDRRAADGGDDPTGGGLLGDVRVGERGKGQAAFTGQFAG